MLGSKRISGYLFYRSVVSVSCGGRLGRHDAYSGFPSDVGWLPCAVLQSAPLGRVPPGGEQIFSPSSSLTGPNPLSRCIICSSCYFDMRTRTFFANQQFGSPTTYFGPNQYLHSYYTMVIHVVLSLHRTLLYQIIPTSAINQVHNLRH
jgi:hypothetical protein